MLLQDLELVLDDVSGTEAVPPVRVARGDLQRHLLAATADEDRQPLLDRPRAERRVLELVVLARVGDLPLVEEAALDAHGFSEFREPDRRRVEVDPVHLVLVLVPRRADAEDRAGWRYVLPVTSMPICGFFVIAPNAASTCQPSRFGPVTSPMSGTKWSHVMRTSQPHDSARSADSRISSHVVYWG